MIFVTGPMFSGKREYLQKALGLSPEGLSARAVFDAERLAAGEVELEQVAARLASYDIVTANEVGCGIVPMEAEQRLFRERAGRLNCLLAQRADTVLRVCCGLPQVLKGEWPC